MGEPLPIAVGIALLVVLVLWLRWMDKRFGTPQVASEKPTDDVAEEIAAQRALSDRDLAIYNAETARQRKSVGVAYALWFLLGWAGAHKFYLGMGPMGVAYAILGIGGYLSYSANVADALSSLASGTLDVAVTPLTVGLLLPWAILMLVDLFTLPAQVQQYDRTARARVLQQLKAQAP